MGADPTFLRSFAETRAFLLGRPGRFQFAPDGAVLFLRTPPRSPVLGLWELDLESKTEHELVTPSALLAGGEESLSDAELARRERQRITDRGFTGFDLSADGRLVLLPLAGRLYLYERETGRVRTLVAEADDAPIDARFSPDGSHVAFVRGHDLWAMAVAEGAGPAQRLTEGGSEDAPNGLAEFVAQEEMARHEGYWWSPDGTRVAFAAVDQRDVERFSIADPARPERAPVSFRYPRPGKANARVRLGIVSLSAASRGAPSTPTWVRWDEARWPYLARVLWQSGRAPLAIYVQSRDQREAAVLAVDEATGATQPLLVESDAAWINLERGLPRWLPDGRGFLHVREEDDHRELVLFGPSGARLSTVVDARAGFLSLVHAFSDGSVLVLEGDALTSRLVRIARNGARTVLVDDGGEREVVASRDGRWLVDTRTAADAWAESRVRLADGTPVTAVRSLAEAPPFRVRLELTTVEGSPTHDGTRRRYHAAIVRPRDFVPGRRYPVIVHAYGGPHALMVKADERHYALDQWIADHGAIVVLTDNRGTPRRGPRWERAVKRRFGRVPLEDQIDALHALGRRYAELNLERVGIYGWSFGGYLAALAALRRPDVFKVAVAGAPVVDWLDYDTHYTERYLDLPDVAPEAYDDGSLLPLARTLVTPLLLIHGTADDNVYFFHSLKLADALFRAGRPFELLPLPRVTHQIGDPVVRERVWARTTEFLLGHLSPRAS